MRAILADDEIHLAADLQRRLQRLWPGLEIAAVLHDGPAVVQALTRLRPDLAFLDIRMPGLSGLEAARAAPPGCRVVFITAFDDHAVQAFELAAADYLLKPVTDARLSLCLERIRQQGAPPADQLLSRLQALVDANAKPQPLRWLRAQSGQTVKMVAVDDICYFQSADKYTAAYTADAELLLRTPLKELLAQLDPETFWQVHRGTAVNVRQIVAAHHSALGKVTLALRDRPEKLAVSRAHAHLFRQM